MIGVEISMEGVLDEDLSLSKKRKSSGRLKIKSRKLIRNLRPSSESVSPGSTDSDPEYMLGGDDEAREIDEIDEDTPGRSARCSKLSQKIIQIKKERQEETDHHEDAAKLVKNRERYHLVEINNINERAEEIPAGLRRSSRTSKPTTEIMNFRKELGDDNTGVERRSRYLYKSKKKLYLSLERRAETTRAPEKASINSKQRVKCSSSNADDVSHPTSPGLTRMPPPVRRKVFRPPAEDVADVTTITPGQARKLCTLMKKIPSVSEHVQVRPLVEPSCS